MQKLMNFMGTVIFWLSWPIIHISVRVQPRTRVLVVCEKEVLVVMDLIGPGRWSLPGGGVHRGESAAEGAIRELREETGIAIEADQLQHHGQYSVVNDERHRYQYEFFVVEFDQKPAVSKQKAELRDLQWLQYQELLADKRTGTLVRERVRAWFD